jgi:hypothetical protein
LYFTNTAVSSSSKDAFFLRWSANTGGIEKLDCVQQNHIKLPHFAALQTNILICKLHELCQKMQFIVSNCQVKQLHSFNQVNSMTPSIKLSEYLYEIATGENGEGNKQRGREREKGSDSSRVRDGALDRSGNGAGWKWPLVKKDTWVFLVKKINGINRLSVKRDKSWVDLGFFISLVPQHLFSWWHVSP